MRLGRELVPLMAGLILLVTVSSQASAGTSGYCLECHSSKFLEAIDRDLSRSSDDRDVYSAKLDPCPGLRSRSEEMFFTESRIVKLDEILQAMEKDGWKTDSLRSRVSESAGFLLDLKRREKISVRQGSREASAIRTALQKTYEHTLQARDESSRRWLIGLGGLFLLGLLVLIGLGYRKLGRMGKTLVRLSPDRRDGFLDCDRLCSLRASEKERQPGTTGRSPLRSGSKHRPNGRDVLSVLSPRGDEPGMGAD